MSWPGGSGDQVPEGVGGVHRLCGRHVFSASRGDLKLACRVTTAFLTLQHSGRRQNLRSMADGRDRFLSGIEGPDQFQDTVVEPEVFGGSASWDHQRVVLVCTGGVEVAGDSESVTDLFAISLIPLKIVNGGFYALTR